TSKTTHPCHRSDIPQAPLSMGLIVSSTPLEIIYATWLQVPMPGPRRSIGRWKLSQLRIRISLRPWLRRLRRLRSRRIRARWLWLGWIRPRRLRPGLRLRRVRRFRLPQNMGIAHTTALRFKLRPLRRKPLSCPGSQFVDC
ncbi:unnamed protein product, partial [Ixodes pacificus]